MGGAGVLRQFLLALLVGDPLNTVLSQEFVQSATFAPTSPGVFRSEPAVPTGCFSYGYKWYPALQNVTGQPFLLGSVYECQQKCQMTVGCFHFAYWQTNKECWLGDLKSKLIRALTKGVIAGPGTCPEDPPACTAIPGPDFPATTDAATRAAWPGGEQPTNLQCWPRRVDGFPDKCRSRLATVLEDTAAGWAGRCDNLRKIDDLQPGETCQLRCFNSALCGVWSVENQSQPGVPTCWHGMNGMNCYSGTGIKPMRAQRVMHGSFRVLMNTMGMQIMNLTKAFAATEVPTVKDGIRRCRKTCLSYLFCQIWQYSSVWGCWIEDPSNKQIAYPLINNGVDMVTQVTTSDTVKAGEYIQHFCADEPTVPLPTDSPETGAVAAPQTGRVALAGANGAHKVFSEDGGAMDVEESNIQAGGVPAWASFLIGFAIALCLVVIGLVVWMSVLEADKQGTKGSRYGRSGYSRYSNGGDSRSSSFASENQPMMSGGSFRGNMPQASWHWNSQQGPPQSGAPPGSHSSWLHWHHGASQPPGYGQQHPQPPTRGWM